MTPHKRPIIGLIFTGGGIAARRNKKTSEMIGLYDFNDWMLQVPEINFIAEIRPIPLFNLAGYEIGPTHWLEIAKAIYANLDKCDGFVVTHGLDTIVYSATAVSFLLRKTGKPVIFTGSRFSPNEEETSSVMNNNKALYKNTLGSIEAKSNLINAVQAATMDIGEVCLLFGSQLLRANRSTLVDLFGKDVFDSARIKSLGKVHFGLELREHRYPRNEEAKPKLLQKIETKIGYIRLFPGMYQYCIDDMMERDFRGIVIKPYFLGEFSSTMYQSLEKARAKDIEIVAVSSALKGSIDFSTYPGAHIGSKLDIISAYDMTPECALTKFMIVLGQFIKHSDIKKQMQKDWAGEISLTK